MWVCLSILFDQTQSKSLICFCFKCSTCCMRVFFLLCLYLISNTRICSIYVYLYYICSMYNSHKCLCSMSGVLFFVCLVCCLDLNIQNITLSQFHLYIYQFHLLLWVIFILYLISISLNTFEMYTYMLQLLEFVFKNNLHKNCVKHALFFLLEFEKCLDKFFSYFYTMHYYSIY